MRAIGIEPEEDEQSEAAIRHRNAERHAAAEAAPQDAPTAPAGGQEAAPQG